MITSPQNDDLRATWFGQVSPDWKLGRAKNAFRVVSKKVGTRSSEYDLLSLTLKGIIPRDLDSGKGKFPESFDTYQEVKRGDIVFCLFDIDETPRTVGLSDMDGMVTGAYTVVRCTELADPRYVTYFYLSIDERKGLRPFYTGLRKVVRTETFLNAAFPLPDLATQRQIADFLNRETARIDLLIEKKQRLVALLGEKYFADLERITFPNDMPTGELVPFRWICRIAEGQVDPTTEMWRDRILIAPNHIESKTGRLLAMETAEEQGAISGKYAFGEGTVLYSKIRPALAKACISPSAGMCSADMYPIIPERGLRPEYLLMQLLSARFTDWATLESMRVAMPKINRETLGAFRLRVPPLDVQDRYIACFAENRTRFEEVTDKINASIDRLKEYRSALITAAVTGQIDVSTYPKSGTPDPALCAIQEEMGA